jgi:predicted alpha/beta-hydrolase family hydrolase
MKVYFSHGKESGPWGTKIKRLANIAKKYGCEVDSVDYSDVLDPDLRVERLEKIIKGSGEDIVLVGSSMGGYVSLVASEMIKPKGLFLLAPALFIPGYKRQQYNAVTTIEVVHGWSDDIIPVESSIKFAQSNHCSLHLIDGDHRLNSSIHIVERLFSQFLDSLKV